MEWTSDATQPGLLARPRTILRAGAAGELLAMIIATHAVFTAGAWMTAAPASLAAWFIIPSSLWIVLRSVGYGSGRVTAVAGTLLALFLVGFGANSTDPTLPEWLTRGPFSRWGSVAVLVGILFIDLCDIPWSRGWSSEETGAALRRCLLKYWGWALGALFAIYMIVIPGVDAIFDLFREPEPTSVVLEDMTFGEAVLLRATEAFTAVWFFVFGAAVGSFLNVVVYRTPRGASLVRNASACPKCNTVIAGRDNIPILGWLWLKGRCRSCQLPISIRYPVVEALVGLIFLVFFFAELLSGGLNLPERTPNSYAGVVWIIFYTKWDLVGLYLFHCLLLIALLTWSLISYDGQRVPFRSIIMTYILATVPVMIWPGLLLVSWEPDESGLWKPTVIDAIAAIGLGSLIGGVVACGASLLLNWKRTSPGPRIDREFVAGASLVGAMLGWQAALSVVALALGLRLVRMSLPLLSSLAFFRDWPLTGALLVGASVQLLTWRLQATYLSTWWPVLGVSLPAIFSWSVCVIVLAMAIRQIGDHDEPSATHEKDAAIAAGS